MVKQTLRYASMALAVQACLAFTAPTGTIHRMIPSSSKASTDFSLSASPTSNEIASSSSSSRRSFLGNVVATTATAVTLLGSPIAALADEEAPAKATSSKIKPLSDCIYNILRVREATQQETRLISTGKFKDVQRANVKLAVKFIVNNYKLSDNIIAASSYLAGNARVQASGVGQNAVQSLYTILEYFDSSDVENIKVGSDSMAGKEAIVVKGLDSVRKDIDDFLGYFPQDVLDQAKARIMSENELNFNEFDPELGSILNPNPK